MHIGVFGFALAALSTIAAGDLSSDLRRPRQLDLGPVPATNQINEVGSSNPRQSNFQPQGYLPPIEPAGAQDDPVILRPTQAPQNPTHHGRDLCTDPFHSFLCSNLKPRKPITGNFPGNSLVGANTFVEPSKVLAPPFNDLEEAFTSTTTPQTSPPAVITTRQTPPPTTRQTPPPTTRQTPPPTIRQTPSPIATTRRTPPPGTSNTPRPTTTTTETPIGPAASNDFRNYLPPERIDPAAAQPDITVVRPDSPEDNHHHHPHHHGRDLCTDPFHSFLCASLKPRKRITGDLPNSLQGQNSFLSPQKVQPEPEVSPQPSNEIDRAYLPPQTTRRPTTTSTTPRFVYQPSNNVIDTAYLPPSTTRRPSTTTTTRRPTTTTTTKRPTPPRYYPQPSNEIDRAYLPPVTTTRRPPPPPTTQRTTTIRFRPEPSNEITRAYLPPITTTTTRRPIPTTAPPLVPQPSNEVDRSYLPPAAPQPTNVENTYLPPEPKFEPAAAQDDPAIAAPDEEHHHHHGSHGFKDICSDPFHSFLCVSPKPRKRITGELPARFRSNSINPSPSNIDESRIRVLEHKTDNLRIIVVPKDTETPAQSRQNDVKIPSPSNTSPNYNYIPPQNKLTLPSEAKEVRIPSSTTQKPTTYNYPIPNIKLNLPSETKQFVGYDYPKPAKPFPGYSYPKPDNRLTLPSEVKEEIIKPTTTTTTTTTTTPKPTTTTTTTTPRPTTLRTTTTTEKLPQPAETRAFTGYEYPKPSNNIPSQGYSYPKPEKTLTLPTEQKEVIGYNYPKPTIPFPPPPKPSKGYDYPKPDRRLTLPTEQRSDFRTTTLSPAKLIVNSFTIPTTRAAPLTNNYYSQITSSPAPKQINNFNINPGKTALPGSIQEARARLQSKNVGNISSQNTLSDFIPVNKVEFPSEGELGVRFGERTKRRERVRHLLPPNGSHRL